MNLRPLIIDAAAHEKAARVIAHAEAHHYVPGPGAAPPGDDPSFTAHFDTYRVVFSITHSDGTVWRHISISVPGGKLPNPIAAFTLAELFGFTGWDGKSMEPGKDWLINVHPDPKCIVIAQHLQPGSVH